MAFQFTNEDFTRYVKVGEHNGRHIWHELEDRFSQRYSVPFTSDRYANRSDPLLLLWFFPRDSPRKVWKYQAKPFLGRPTKESLHVGLHIQRPLASFFDAKIAVEKGWKPPSDGVRFLERVKNDAEMLGWLKRILAQPGWDADILTWAGAKVSTGDDKVVYILSLSADPGLEGLDIYLRRSIPAEEVVAAGEQIADMIMDTFLALEPIWMGSLPDEERAYLQAGGSDSPTVATGRRSSNTAVGRKPETQIDVLGLVRNQLEAQHLYFTDWQIATFYTALQTKGFVILSGISGTGKTKLAQAFAEMLPSPASQSDVTDDDVIALTVQPYMAKYSRIIIPKRAARLFEPLPPGEARQVTLRYGDKSSKGRLAYSVYPGTNYIGLYLRGEAKQWFEQNFKPADTLILTPELNGDGELEGFGLAREQDLKPSAVDEPRSHNHLFVPVRTDWRDSKSLLGYYNPLTESYEWTAFLRFLLRAAQSYSRKDGMAWFVILDEMNLARVEYYFADLLSILESGRDHDGWTREPLRLVYPENAEGELPPAELRLPPNLYVVGTVNVDETTHAFSPKVLDRAFTLELTEADFSAYPSGQSGASGHLSDGERQGLLDNFSFSGRFAQMDKAAIAAMVGRRLEVRARLQTLNSLLRQQDLHFGYRVFDEITTFLIAAERNLIFESLGGFEFAFDAAVLMKVLPKFNGSRGKLEMPLKAVLAWCINPDAPDAEGIDGALQNVQSNIVRAALASLDYRYPKTADRTGRMLSMLYTDGFASFG